MVTCSYYRSRGKEMSGNLDLDLNAILLALILIVVVLIYFAL